MTPPRETTLPFTTAVFVRTTDPPMATTFFSTVPLTVIWPPIVITLWTFCARLDRHIAADLDDALVLRSNGRPPVRAAAPS